jgi:hypothetical protein
LAKAFWKHPMANWPSDASIFNEIFDNALKNFTCIEDIGVSDYMKTPREENEKNKKMSKWSSYRMAPLFWERVRNGSAAEGRSYNGLIIDSLQRYRYREITKDTDPILTPLQVMTQRRIMRETMESIVVGRHGKDNADAAPPRSAPFVPISLPPRTAVLKQQKGLLYSNIKPRDAYGDDDSQLVTIKIPFDLHTWMKYEDTKVKPPVKRKQSLTEILFLACAQYLDVTRLNPEPPITEEEAAVMRRVALYARQSVRKGIYLKSERRVGKKEGDWIRTEAVPCALYACALEEGMGIQEPYQAPKKKSA